MIINYYTLLNIEQKADLYTIKKAFRKEITMYHPDNNKSSDARLQFELRVEAFEVLSDIEKRNAYDQLLSHQATNKPVVIEQKEQYEDWKKEAKTKSKTYRESSLSELFLLNIFAEAGINGLFEGSKALMDGSESLLDGLGDTLGDVIGGIFDSL
jgi:DnaJ-class molecular chaperone